MNPADVLEIAGDDEEQQITPENLTSNETKILDTVDDAWKNIDHEAPADSNISANADGKRASFADLHTDIKTTSQTSGSSGGAEIVNISANADGKRASFADLDIDFKTTSQASGSSGGAEIVNISANADGKRASFADLHIDIKTTSQRGAEIVDSEEEVLNYGDGGGKTSLHLKPSPSLGVSLESFMDASICSSGKSGGSENGSAMMDEAWEQLRKSYVRFNEQRVGTLAAVIDNGGETLNYNQVFVRDFVPAGLACLMKADADVDIVKNFLLKTLHLQGWEKRIDNFTLGEGVMPASFKVILDPDRKKEVLQADFGGTAIGRVAPVDSGFWWIILLRSYTKFTHDYSLAELPEVQRGIKLILNLCLSDGFDTFPTLLCADGCSMIDRRMGIYGYPIEIQALFFFALRCAKQLLKPEYDAKELIESIEKRITALRYHMQNYYWLDFTQLNNIYRYKTEEYSHTAVNKFNVIPESIPDWVFEFMPMKGGYFIGNVSPARMDFRWFLVGNCIAILSCLATPSQATAIMDLIEERWDVLIGEMPLKIVYPALEGHEWTTVTGCDPKNTRWSYHNGGSWPVLLWLLTAASIKTGRPQIAKRAIELVEQRLAKDGWPEYYDGITGRYIGKQARKNQTWSVTGYLVAKLMIENPSNLLIISLEEDKKTAKPKLTRSASWTC